MPLLEVRGLRGGYGRIPILNGIDFAIEPGEIVGVLGHNGMGKTTLMKALMGFVPATAGSILLDGVDISAAPPFERARRGLGYVPQGRDIFPRLSVRDNLAMGAARLDRGADAAVAAALEEFPALAEMRDRAGGTLSGGQQQQLAIARALCAGPRLLLLDEPTEGIQPSVIEAIAEMLERLNRTRSLAILLVEQHLEFVAQLARRVLVIQKGAIVAEHAGERLRDPAIADSLVGIGT